MSNDFGTMPKPGLAGRPAASLQGIWLSWSRYEVFDPVTGLRETVFIPTQVNGKELYEPSELAELEHLAKEEVMAGWNRKKPTVPMTRDQQHDLGQTLMEIKSSNQHRRETGHSRWWKGAN